MGTSGYTTISLSNETYLALRSARESVTQLLGRSVSMDQIVAALLREIRSDRDTRRLARLVESARDERTERSKS